MADSDPTEVPPRPQEVSPRPQKIPKLDKPGEDSKTTTKYGRLRIEEPETDEFMRQFLLFHYDFYRTQGFGIDWNKFDFFFPLCEPCDGAPRIDWKQTNEGFAEEMTLRAIAKHNKENGTNIVFVEHIEANFSNTSFLELWITFRAKDMSSPCPEPKIYQAHTQLCASTFLVPVFRVKPTYEEMAAAPIPVNPPCPYHIDYDKPVVFSFAGPGDDPVPGTPFIFNRNPPPEEEEEEEEESKTEPDIETESESPMNKVITIAKKQDI